MESATGKPPARFTCYFCNETIQNETEMGHTATCSRVLVPCPNNCGVFIPRIDLKRHTKNCINKVVKSSQIPTKSQYTDTITSKTIHSNIQDTNDRFPGNNGASRTYLKDELTKLSRKIAEIETRLQFHQKQTQQSASQYDLQTLKVDQLQLRSDSEKLRYQFQGIQNWKTTIDGVLAQLNRSLAMAEQSQQSTIDGLSALQGRLSIVDRLQEELGLQRDSFRREQAYNRQVEMNAWEAVEDLKKQFAQETAKNLAILADLKDGVAGVKLGLEEASVKLEDHGIRFTNVNFDLRGVSKMAGDCGEKIRGMEEELLVAKKDLDQMKLDVEILEGLASSADMRSTPGSLMWKIGEVDSCMTKAKETGIVLKSPVFYTHEYGYKIRVLLYLNGLNKWKDRYALLSLHVIKGEYDLLLKWPCHIEGTITLKDLNDVDSTKLFTKTITAKRKMGDEECEDPQESSSCYIFIPHTTLFKGKFIKNDTMFIDVKIRQIQKLETSF
ncbi:unnamed protein product [Phyllotreta striolata]|uniref:TNF receptor-associated factor 3 n=1 Tax=Phyllotreta striolata TaxID=444603 RepID=A0A9N9THN3_PHYSR|nr:unnamed protein product [Phyllotreta striolata]